MLTALFFVFVGIIIGVAGLVAIALIFDSKILVGAENYDCDKEIFAGWDYTKAHNTISGSTGPSAGTYNVIQGGIIPMKYDGGISFGPKDPVNERIDNGAKYCLELRKDIDIIKAEMNTLYIDHLSEIQDSITYLIKEVHKIKQELNEQ